MKVPRDLSGSRLADLLSRVGYRVTRQTARNIRLTADASSKRHITIPAHESLKLSVLNLIIGDVAINLGIKQDELKRKLFS